MGSLNKNAGFLGGLPVASVSGAGAGALLGDVSGAEQRPGALAAGAADEVASFSWNKPRLWSFERKPPA